MEKNLIVIFILFLFLMFVTISPVYKQITLRANLLNDRKYMKHLVRLIVFLVLSIIFLYICCFLNIPVVDKTWMFLQGTK